ncbi:hypothetical protein BT63DRAFT_173115 [Microthyrium microscopicum]|uniref:Uncharacterized protein n=1 Tax=Microthyrium microscopicum TaxID=703497 RepID=A0A6A6TW53_9PEZI|nr:hypothetical protein BT63DRAFT_173224 [Microthyrium microscopicum]KAF2663088.1 hypothetical protein BT63DRAFT_173115 [Microthyrium microscopicum]
MSPECAVHHYRSPHKLCCSNIPPRRCRQPVAASITILSLTIASINLPWPAAMPTIEAEVLPLTEVDGTLKKKFFICTNGILPNTAVVTEQQASPLNKRKTLNENSIKRGKL